MLNPLSLLGQMLVLGMVMAFIGYFSSRPIYVQVPPGMAQIKLSFAHAAAREVECRKLSSKEIAKLPANEKRPNTCSRKRIPLHVELALDGKTLYRADLQATGLANDGPARAYEKFLVPAGTHMIVARMRDSKRRDGYDYEAVHKLTLQAYQNLAIDFKPDTGGFQFR